MDSGQLGFAALLAGTLSRWRLALAVAAATVSVALVLSLVLPAQYRSASTFVTTESGMQLPRGLSDLALEPGISGIASQLGLGSSSDPSESPAFYAQLLQSRELVTRLALSHFPDPRTEQSDDSVTLIPLLGIRSKDSVRAVELAVQRLRRKVRVNFDPKTNLVGVRVDARWPTLSADIANRAVALVSAFNREQRGSRATARREFLESRVAAALGELRAAEDSQRQFYERNRLWENSPGLIVEERRVRRQVETASSLYLSLRQQYEAARIDEVNTTPVITVVDRAVPPRRRQWPQRTLIVAAAAVLGTAFGWLAAAARELGGHWARQNPEQAVLLRGTLSRVRGEVTRSVAQRRRAASTGNGPV